MDCFRYHGGLNTAVWKRTVPKRIDVSEEPASEEDRLPSGAESAEKMICYWKAKDTTSEQTLTGEWQEKETGEKTSDGDSSVEGMSCSTCGCTGDASETSEEDKKQDSTGSVQRETAPLYLSPTVGRKPAEREKRDSVPSGPGSWLLLFSFLLTVILYRVFLVPEATICARR